MSDDVQIGQDEIEALLNQAKEEAAGKAKPPDEPAPTTDAAGGDALKQDEIEALVKSEGKTAAAPAATAAATAATPAAPAKKRDADDGSIAPGDIDLLLRQAEDAIASVNQPSAAPAEVQPFQLRNFAGASPTAERSTLELIRDVELDLKIELGRTHLPLEEVLKLRKGSVVPLEKLAGDPVDIFVNGRLIARGEVLVLNDNFCVRVTELIAGEAVA